MQARFPLHSGRILGLPGHILISAMGLVVAVLSVTGVVIWWRKRRARLLAADRRRVSEDQRTVLLPCRAEHESEAGSRPASDSEVASGHSQLLLR